MFRETIVQFLLHVAKISNILPKIYYFPVHFHENVCKIGKIAGFLPEKNCVFEIILHMFFQQIIYYAKWLSFLSK